MLLQYFGFKEEPFGVTPDPRFLYPSETHREALASIRYSFQSNRGFTALIAPAGMGKTTLLRRFLEHVRETTCSVFLFNIDPACEPREFTGYILREIGIAPGSTSREMHEQLSDALVTETRAGRKFVVVIDEAQNLSDAVLERVRLLTNFETSRGKLMHIVLSGQPQLSKKLLQPSLVQLRQRISNFCRLEPFSEEDTRAYINYRLQCSGYQGESLFEIEALSRIAEASQGIPRNINNLCFNALSLCCALKKTRVDSSMVAEVIEDLGMNPRSEDVFSPSVETADGQRNEPYRQTPIRNLVRASAILLVIGFLGTLGFAAFRHYQPRRIEDPRPSQPMTQPTAISAPLGSQPDEESRSKSMGTAVTFGVTIEPGETLQDISIRYLGEYDSLRLRQIQKLNPSLTDPNHIETGQRLLLPVLSTTSLARDAAHQESKRTLP